MVSLAIASGTDSCSGPPRFPTTISERGHRPATPLRAIAGECTVAAHPNDLARRLVARVPISVPSLRRLGPCLRRPAPYVHRGGSSQTRARPPRLPAAPRRGRERNLCPLPWRRPPFLTAPAFSEIPLGDLVPRSLTRVDSSVTLRQSARPTLARPASQCPCRNPARQRLGGE